SRISFHAIVINCYERTRSPLAPEEVLKMLTKTRSAPVHFRPPEVIPDTITGPISPRPPVEVPNTARAREAAADANGTETQTERFRRKALRGRLHGYAIAVVAL